MSVRVNLLVPTEAGKQHPTIERITADPKPHPLSLASNEIMKKGWIFGIIAGVLLLVVVAVAVVAAGVGGEASKMDAMLKEDLKQHKNVEEIKKQLVDAGYSIQQETPNLKATGPKHSLVVYATWLTVDLGFDPTGALTSFHLDRAS